MAGEVFRALTQYISHGRCRQRVAAQRAAVNTVARRACNARRRAREVEACIRTQTGAFLESSLCLMMLIALTIVGAHASTAALGVARAVPFFYNVLVEHGCVFCEVTSICEALATQL